MNKKKESNAFQQADASSKVQIQNQNVTIKKRLALLRKLATNVGRNIRPYLLINS